MEIFNWIINKCAGRFFIISDYFKVEAWKMAKAGLLYTGQLEEVKCPFCGVSISDWQYGDQVKTEI